MDIVRCGFDKAGRRVPRTAARGAAAVEFAMVFPILAALVMGSMDFGYFFFSKQIVTNAAREGARAGTMTDPDTGSTQAMATARQAALAYMTNGGVGCPGGGSACIAVTNPTVVPPGGPTVKAIDVVIQYPFTSLTGFTAIVIPHTVLGHSFMRWE